MNSTRFHFFRRVLVWCALMAGILVPAFGKPEQPNMHAALDALREAKRNTTPVPSLKEAKGRLKGAAKNKSRYRVEAMALVDRALELIKAGDKREAVKLIDQAITKVERGIAAGN
jgi:hypothetical protein